MDRGAWWAAVHGVAKSQTRLSDFTFASLSCIGEGNGNPLQCSCLENPRDGGGWWAAIYGVAQSRTRLKRLSSSSSGIDTCYLGSQVSWLKFAKATMLISAVLKQHYRPKSPEVSVFLVKSLSVETWKATSFFFFLILFYF